MLDVSKRIIYSEPLNRERLNAGQISIINGMYMNYYRQILFEAKSFGRPNFNYNVLFNKQI